MHQRRISDPPPPTLISLVGQVIMARLFMEKDDNSWNRVLQQESKACASELADTCILNSITEFAEFATQQKSTSSQM